MSGRLAIPQEPNRSGRFRGKIFLPDFIDTPNPAIVEVMGRCAGISMHALEATYLTSGAPVTCGIDEAGRGPLAGPVVAAAVVLNPGRVPEGIDDSKKLTPETRERLYGEIVQSGWIGVGHRRCRTHRQHQYSECDPVGDAGSGTGVVRAAERRAGGRQPAAGARLPCRRDRRRRCPLSVDRRRVDHRQSHARSSHVRAGARIFLTTALSATKATRRPPISPPCGATGPARTTAAPLLPSQQH